MSSSFVQQLRRAHRESCLPHLNPASHLDLRRRGYGRRGRLLDRVGLSTSAIGRGLASGWTRSSASGARAGPRSRCCSRITARLLGRVGGGRGGAAKPRAAVRGDDRAVGARSDPLQAVDDRRGNRRWAWVCWAAWSATTSWSPPSGRSSGPPCRSSTSSSSGTPASRSCCRSFPTPST